LKPLIIKTNVEKNEIECEIDKSKNDNAIDILIPVNIKEITKMNFDIKEILTLPTSIMAAISLASGILLFSPEILLKKLFMMDFINKNGFILGIVFVVSISILIVNIIFSCAKSFKNAKARKQFYATAEKRLRKLTSYQKAIIYLLYIQDNRTFELPLNDGAIRELEQNKMVGKATTQYMVSDLINPVFPYLLQPWVANELSKKGELLDEFLRAYNTVLKVI